jgi:hypothetical protein
MPSSKKKYNPNGNYFTKKQFQSKKKSSTQTKPNVDLSEKRLHVDIIEYLREWNEYSRITGDYQIYYEGSKTGMKLVGWQIGEVKRLGQVAGMPDLFIYEWSPRINLSQEIDANLKYVNDFNVKTPNRKQKTTFYSGLCIELKTPKKTGHLSDVQIEKLEGMKQRNYRVEVRDNFYSVIDLIYMYMKHQVSKEFKYFYRHTKNSNILKYYRKQIEFEKLSIDSTTTMEVKTKTRKTCKVQSENTSEVCVNVKTSKKTNGMRKIGKPITFVKIPKDVIFIE